MARAHQAQAMRGVAIADPRTVILFRPTTDRVRQVQAMQARGIVDHQPPSPSFPHATDPAHQAQAMQARAIAR